MLIHDHDWRPRAIWRRHGAIEPMEVSVRDRRILGRSSTRPNGFHVKEAT